MKASLCRPPWFCSDKKVDPLVFEGFREVDESHPAVLWLGGVVEVSDDLRNAETLILASA